MNICGNSVPGRAGSFVACILVAKENQAYLCFWLLTGNYFIFFVPWRMLSRGHSEKPSFHLMSFTEWCFCSPLWLPFQLFSHSIHTYSFLWLSPFLFIIVVISSSSSSSSSLFLFSLSWSLPLSSDGEGQDDCYCGLTPSIASCIKF